MEAIIVIIIIIALVAFFNNSGGSKSQNTTPSGDSGRPVSKPPQPPSTQQTRQTPPTQAFPPNVTSGTSQPISKPINVSTAKLFKDKSKYNPSSIICLTTYHPYRKGRNPFFDKNSSLIIELKNEKEPAIRHFASLVLNSFPFGSDFALCIVPSSSKDKNTSGIKSVAKIICSKSGCTDATDCLVRVESIPKLAHGGKRDESVHLNTIKMFNATLIRGREVLLLDDVTTSNNYLNECAKILKDAGASMVQRIAIAQTADDFQRVVL